jgi:hypothetical protein
LGPGEILAFFFVSDQSAEVSSLWVPDSDLILPAVVSVHHISYCHPDSIVQTVEPVHPECGLRGVRRCALSLSWLDHFGSLASILGLLIGLPAILAALYQAQKARQEAKQVREGSMHSRDCLEFIVGDGTTINVVPLETLNWLPRAGDIILLPGDGVGEAKRFIPGAYLVESLEHFYAPATHKRRRHQEARLTKVVCAVTTLNPTFDIRGLKDDVPDEASEEVA